MKKSFLKQLKNLFKNKFFYFALIVFLLSFFVSYFSAKYLLSLDNLCVSKDLILDNFPYYNIAFLYDSFIFLAIFIFLTFIINNKKIESIAYYLWIFGIFYLIRGILIILTPLSNPYDNYNQIFNGGFLSAGLFPSGHVGISFLIILLTEGIYKKLAVVSVIGIIIALIFSKGHYSIDIFCAFILAYAIYVFSEKHLKNFFVEKSLN